MAAGAVERHRGARQGGSVSAARVARLAAGRRGNAPADHAKTKAIYVNTPNNPTGGVLTADDLQAIAALAVEHNLFVISDEAYEDVVYDGAHVSIASLPGMYERTIPLYTLSKTYAMTGLRLAYVAVKNPTIRDRVRKMLFLTCPTRRR